MECSKVRRQIMKSLANGESKLLLFGMIFALIMFIFFGQLSVWLISDEYKQNMVEHDYRLAGYLLEKGVEPLQLAKAFTADKTIDQAKRGSELLMASGYTPDTPTYLLAKVQAFHQKYALIFLVFSLVFSLIIVSVLFLFFWYRNQKIEKANERIQAFMAGKTQIGLPDKSEGSLSQLFASINGMATALTTHIDSEKHGREFLKDIISDISHQLKTPLAALRMYNEIIQNEQVHNKVVNAFTLKSERELTRMEILIQNLLKLARMDAGTIELEIKNHNVKGFLEEVIKGFMTRAEMEKKTIVLDLEENIMLEFDNEWLLEAVGNILKNAMDHTSAKDKIEIKCKETPILTTITIKDNGRGIHPEDIHHIFKRFYRSRFSKDKQGVGIGLTLSKTIVERHGGTISVESDFGKGTIFRLVFPKVSNL